MADAKITKKPSKQVSGHSAPSPTWGSNPSFKSSWKVPKDLSSGKKSDRATNLLVTWAAADSKTSIGGNAVTISMSGSYKQWKKGIGVTEHTVSLSNLSARAQWHPLKAGRFLKFVSCGVTPYNSKGYGKTDVKHYEVAVPDKPTIALSAISAANGKVTVNIKTAASAGHKERYDTQYVITRYDSRTGATTTLANTSTTSADWSASYDTPNYQSLSQTQFVRFTVRACARGLAGDSAWVTAQHTVARPAKPTVNGTPYVSSMGTGGKLIVPVKTNSTQDHPVDGVKLQLLTDTTITSETAASQSAEWDDAGAKDDAGCTALLCDISQVIPTAGKHTWVRVVAWHDIEETLWVASEPVMVASVESIAPTADTTHLKLASVTPNADGKSATAIVAWTDSNTGTEISWSDEPDTWESTDEPETHSFTWKDSAAAISGYSNSATINIKGLDEGTVYYVRARRYLDNDGNVTYSAYSDTETVLPVTSPSSVVLMCDGYVARGSDLPVSWSYDSTAEQRRWALVASDGTVIAEGTDPYGSTVISSERLDAIAGMLGTAAIAMHAEVSTGGALVESAERVVRIVDAPELEIAVGSTLTAQPMSFSAAVSSECDLTVVVTADGIGGQAPYGTLAQMAGDSVWSALLSPQWSDGEAVITLPEGLAFHDGGSYTLTAVATDRTTGLQSETSAVRFSVGWSHQAPEVPEELTVTPSDTTDEDGNRVLSVSIQLEAPEDAEETDVYDIYRVTADGSNLVGRGYALDELVTDNYAPYGDGEHSYIVCIRTADGDTSWYEYAYELPCDVLRFDFEGGYVELPWNIGVQDAYEKDFEARKHLDGSTGGYWSAGIGRKAGLSSDVIRLDDPEQHAAVRELARYAGSVFVRTPNGTAYEANVNVDGMDASYDGAFTAISITAEEIAPTGAYDMPLPAADITDDTEQEG